MSLVTLYDAHSLFLMEKSDELVSYVSRICAVLAVAHAPEVFGHPDS